MLLYTPVNIANGDLLLQYSVLRINLKTTTLLLFLHSTYIETNRVHTSNKCTLITDKYSLFALFNIILLIEIIPKYGIYKLRRN